MDLAAEQARIAETNSPIGTVYLTNRPPIRGHIATTPSGWLIVTNAAGHSLIPPTAVHRVSLRLGATSESDGSGERP